MMMKIRVSDNSIKVLFLYGFNFEEYNYPIHSF